MPEGRHGEDRDLSEPIEKLVESIESLRRETRESRAKDPWDKTAVLMGFLTPLVIAVVGGYYTYTNASLEREERTARAEREEIARDAQAELEREARESLKIREIESAEARARQELTVDAVELIHSFMPYLVGQDAVAQQVALRAIAAVSVERAQGLAQTLGSLRADKNPSATDALVASIATLKVTISRLEVLGDCDQLTDLDGDFYYDFAVNGKNIARVPRESTRSAADGESISIDSFAEVSVLVDSLTSIMIRGTVADKDRFTSGGDDVLGTVEHELLLRNEPWTEDEHEMDFFADEGCHAKAFYSIEAPVYAKPVVR